MNKSRILIVDDDPSIRKFVRANLNIRDYAVTVAENGLEAINIIKRESMDLMILDIMMPYLNGYEVCRQVRESSMLPIIMLSAKDEETDKLRCLELGADDYLTKPFSLNELLCRVKNLLKRTQGSELAPSMLKFACGELEIDYDRRIVSLNGQEINLTDTEYRILDYLARNAGRIIAPEHILEKVWGQDYLDKRRMLWTNISRLRGKLNSRPGYNYIQTRPGIGYVIKGSTSKHA